MTKTMESTDVVLVGGGTLKSEEYGRLRLLERMGATLLDLDRPAADLDAALAEVTDIYLRDAIWFHHPSYVAHLNCPVALPAVLAEGIISAVNTSVDTWDQSAGGTLVEQRLIRWTAGRIGFGETADGVFTSGGTQSNLQGLLLARGEAVRRHGEGVQSRLRVLATEHSHFSVIKAARIMGLQTPTAKMSKSGDAETDALYLLDPPEVVTRKVKRAVTDTDNAIGFDIAAKPGVSNLLSMLAALSGEAIPALVDRFEGKGYGHLKGEVAERVVALLTPIQTRYHEVRAAPDYLQQVLREGAQRATEKAAITLDRVHDALGYIPR